MEKKFTGILILIIIIGFSGCDLVYDKVLDDTILGYHPTYYSEEFDELDSFEKIAEYISERVAYYTWTSAEDPEVILEMGYADCKGFSILFANIAHYSMGIDCKIVGVDVDDYVERGICSGGYIDHFLVYYKGIFEPQSGGYVEYTDIKYIYDWDDYLYEE